MIAQVMITTIVDRNEKVFGFARRTDDGTEVFVPPHPIRNHNLTQGEVVFAEIGENPQPPQGSKITQRVEFVYDEDGPFAHLLQKFKSPAPQPVQFQTQRQEPYQPTYDDCVSLVDSMLDEDVVLITRDVKDALNEEYGSQITSAKVGSWLESMHKADILAIIQMHRKPNQARASRVAWMRSSTALEVFDELYGEED